MYSGKATYVQSEFPYAMGLNSNVPKFIPGMVGGDDFFYFVVPIGMPKYTVLVSTLIGDHYGNFNKSLGPLKGAVMIPNAQIDPKGSVTLIPEDKSYPVYVGAIRRGRQYSIPPLPNFGKGGRCVIDLLHC